MTWSQKEDVLLRIQAKTVQKVGLVGRALNPPYLITDVAIISNETFAK